MTGFVAIIIAGCAILSLIDATVAVFLIATSSLLLFRSAKPLTERTDTAVNLLSRTETSKASPFEEDFDGRPNRTVAMEDRFPRQTNAVQEIALSPEPAHVTKLDQLECRIDFNQALQQSLIGFQNAWDAGDDRKVICNAQSLQSACNRFGKRDISIALDMLIRATAEAEETDYSLAIREFLSACSREIEQSEPTSSEPISLSSRPEKLTHSTNSQHIRNPIKSALPEDPVFVDIAVEFVPQLENRLREMDNAIQKKDFQAVASLAHWLKGAGGTCGFADFTAPSMSLETAAEQNNLKGCCEKINQLWEMAQRIVIEAADHL